MSAGEGSVTCEEDGKWSAQTAHCVMTCPHPVTPANSRPRENDCSDGKRTLFPGTSCKYQCKPGYSVKESDGARNIFKMRCTKSGRWTHPVCEPTKCPSISVMAMWYNCSNGNAMGSVCTSFCPGQEVRTTFYLKICWHIFPSECNDIVVV